MSEDVRIEDWHKFLNLLERIAKSLDILVLSAMNPKISIKPKKTT